jgi:hypothetical protein
MQELKTTHGSHYLEPAGEPVSYVSDRLGITREQLGDAIHEIKAASDLSPADRIIIYDDGTVTDERGDVLGNIYNEM